MKILATRSRLLSSAAVGVCGAVALAAFPTSAAAQVATVTCSQTGTSVNCTNGSTPIASGFVDGTTVVTAGPGFVATDPDSVNVILNAAGNGPIATTSDNQDAFFVRTTNDLTAIYNGDVTTGGAFAFGYEFISSGTTTVQVGNASTTANGGIGLSSTSTGDAVILFDNITTSGGGAIGVRFVGSGAGTLTTDGNIATSGAGSEGVFASTAGDLLVNLVDISTTGTSSDGVDARATGGNTTVVANNVTATADGISAQSVAGTVTVDAKNVESTEAGNGIDASGAGAVVVTAKDVTTADGFGILASSTAGSVTVSCNDVSASGDGASGVKATAAAGSDATLTCANVSTNGVDAIGAIVQGDNVVANVANVTTTGAASGGVSLHAVNGSVSATIADVTTTGQGITAVATTSVDLTAGNVTTSEDNGLGVSTSGPTTNNTTVQNVTTAGDNADAIKATGDVVTLIAGDISTAGLNSEGVHVDAVNSATLLFMEHGSAKLFHFPVPQPGVSDPLPPLLLAAALIEVVGGVFVVLGLFTRLAAFIMAGEIAVGYFLIHFPQSFWPIVNQGEAAILFCFIFLYLASAGPGAWSLEGLRRRSRSVPQSPDARAPAA